MAETSTAVAKHTVKSLVESPAYSKRFTEVLGKNAPQFVSSLVQISQSWNLKDCEPNSVIAAALVAAALDLPINPNLGFAYVIPYKDRASFQMGYKGFIQLGQRSGQYKHLNSCEVYDGDLQSYDRLKGEVILDEKKRKKNAEIVGYAAYFKLTNGHEHGIYWTNKEVQAHAEKYSQAYRKGSDTPWKTNFDQMAMKTVIKKLISTYGPLSIHMQQAMERDQTVEVDGVVSYPDNGGEPIPSDAPPVFKEPAKGKGKGKAEPADANKRPEPSAIVQVAVQLKDVSFDDFADYIVNQGIRVNLRDKCAGYDDLPADLCEKLLKDPKHLDTIVKTYGKK